MNSLIEFAFEEHRVCVVTRDGDVWFVAKDVCDALDIRNASDAVSELDRRDVERVPVSILNIGTYEVQDGTPVTQVKWKKSIVDFLR